MANRSITLDDRLYDYLLSVSPHEPPLLARLREETAALPESVMQIGPEQGQFMALLIELIGARRCLEVGTFTGYSTLAVALALPEDGTIVACDISADFTAMGQRFWEEAGVAHKIDLRIAPALGTLDDLIDEGQDGTFDFAFVDADKENYDGYLERAYRLLRTGGLLAVDNVLWGGKVADPAADDKDTTAIREINEQLRTDERFTLSLVPIGDGLTLARKR